MKNSNVKGYLLYKKVGNFNIVTAAFDTKYKAYERKHQLEEMTKEKFKIEIWVK